MRYDIEGFITFDTEDASLLNVLTGDCVELSQTSTRLLAELLNHRGDILSRSEIFHSVFDQYGARASNSNLNQYISTLRRNLNDWAWKKRLSLPFPALVLRLQMMSSSITTASIEPRSWKKKPQKPRATPLLLRCLKG